MKYGDLQYGSDAGIQLYGDSEIITVQEDPTAEGYVDLERYVPEFIKSMKEFHEWLVAQGYEVGSEWELVKLIKKQLFAYTVDTEWGAVVGWRVRVHRVDLHINVKVIIFAAFKLKVYDFLIRGIKIDFHWRKTNTHGSSYPSRFSSIQILIGLLLPPRLPSGYVQLIITFASPLYKDNDSFWLR